MLKNVNLQLLADGAEDSDAEGQEQQQEQQEQKKTTHESEPLCRLFMAKD